ncbi:methyltransferase [Thozetella sp. PMI_491]|nr:methyltransferase [Thozetella sp. PMI_491]
MAEQDHSNGNGKGPDKTYATVYSRSFLSIFYDYYVLGFNMKYIWGCPATTILLPFFAENFSRRHLDIGVATGYFPAAALAQPFRKDSKQELTLVDINPNPLNATKARVLSVTTKTTVETVLADVTEPLPKELQDAKFDSISAFNLFHCMPGGPAKLAAISTLRDALSDHGVLSGCTVLGPAHATGPLSRFYLRWYNKWWGVFNNWDDRREDFEEALRRDFEDVETWVIGLTLLFRATKPRRGDSGVLINLGTETV